MPDDFYQKHLDCGGIVIRSSAAVDDRALQVAANKIDRMLRHIPDVRARLVAAGVTFSVIGKNEKPSDLPHLRDQRDKVWVDNRGIKTTIDTRGRGYGGLHTCCAEEIILNLPDNPYPPGQDIGTHEFAHTIMDYGFDDTKRQSIERQYATAITAGLWKESYAAVDAKEYWAELSMWFFGGHGDCTGDAPAGDGPEALYAYDAHGFTLLEELYEYGLKPTGTT